MSIAVLFDLDDTLLDNFQAFKQAIAEVFPERLFQEQSFIKLYRIFRMNSEKIFEQFRVEAMKNPNKKFDRWRVVLTALGEKEDKDCLMKLDEHYHRLQTKLQLSEKFVELFDFLKQKNIQMGLLSNGIANKQEQKIKQLGLAKYIEADKVFISELLGVSKPSIQCYTMVRSRLPHDIAKIIYLGDSYVNDIKPAYQVDWQPIWLNRFAERADSKEIITVKNIDQAIAEIKNIIG